MARRGKDNYHMKSGQLRRRGQYRIQYVMMIVYRMPGKMRAALKIKFLHKVMKIKRQSSCEKLGIFFEKIMIYYFYVSQNRRPFEEKLR